MLLQSLLLVVTLALIGSALLTSSLVSAKSTFHSLVLRQSRSAMTDGTASFITWAQNNVKQNGIDQLPVWAATPTKLSPEAVCGEKRHALNATSVGCRLYRTISWNVTGFTDVNIARVGEAQESKATNLAIAQNERRISATVTVTVSEIDGSNTYARASREITARLFHAFPYVTVTGERDSMSESGSINSAEGDTAGFTKQPKFGVPSELEPTLNEPASYTKTSILTTVNCENTNANSSNDPELDNENVNFARLRSYGNMAWSYEVPCKSVVPINPKSAPAGYRPPPDNVYGSESSRDQGWDKNDDDRSSFGH